MPKYGGGQILPIYPQYLKTSCVTVQAINRVALNIYNTDPNTPVFKIDTSTSTVTLNGTLSGASMRLSLIDGTSTSPALRFQNSLGTGLYLSGANQMSIATAGSETLRCDASGNTTVLGNLYVNGTSTTINSSVVNVSDNIINVGSGNVADSLDLGMCFQYVSSGTKYGALYRASGTDNWYIKDGITSSPGNTVSGGTLANLYVAKIAPTSFQMTTGAVNNYVLTCDASGNGVWSAGGGGGVSSLTGTANQVIVSASTGGVTLSTPQSIGLGSTPTFAGLQFNDVTAAAWEDAGIGLSGAQPTYTDTTSSGAVFATITHNLWGGTYNASHVTTYDKAITLHLYDPFAGTNVTFTNIYSLYAEGAIYADSITLGSGALTGLSSVVSSGFRLTAAPTVNYYIKADSSGNMSWANPATNLVTSLTGTANQVIVSGSVGAITLSTPQNLNTTANVTFATVTATVSTASQPNITTLGGVTSLNSITVGAGTLSGLTSVNSSLVVSGGFRLTTTPTANYYIKADSSGNMSWANPASDFVTALTGTANQVIVSGSVGSITLSTPQSISTGSTPQFAKLGLGVASVSNAMMLITPSLTTSSLTGNGISIDSGTYTIAATGTAVNNIGLTATTLATGASFLAGIIYANIRMNNSQVAKSGNGTISTAYGIYSDGFLSLANVQYAGYFGAPSGGATANVALYADNMAIGTSGATPPASGLAVTGKIYAGAVNTANGEQIKINGDASQNYMAVYNNTTRTGYVGSNASGLGFIVNSDNSDLTLQASSTNNTLIRTNATERVRVTSAGLVGIGTNSTNAIGPGALLDVFSQANTTTYQENVWLRVSNNAGATNYSRMIIGQNSTNAYFVDVNNQSNTKGTLQLMPFAGNLCVGTTSGSIGVLTVNGANTTLRFAQDINGNITGAGANSAIGGLLIENVCVPSVSISTSPGTSSLYIYHNVQPPTGVTVTNAVGMFIDGGLQAGVGTVTNGYGLYVNTPNYGTNKYCAYFQGNVGIGITAPLTVLHVDNTASNVCAYFQTEKSDNASSSFRRIEVGQYNFRSSIQGQYLSGTWQASDLLLNPNGGYVGIGTTAPGFPLQVNQDGNANNYKIATFRNANTGSSAVAGITITAGSASEGGQLFHYSSTAATDANAFSIINLSAAALRLGVNNAEAMRISSAGNVGIGTTTPNSPLQFPNTVNRRQITLWESANDTYQYYGFGLLAGTLVYNVPSTAANHIFYAATSSSAANELMRIQGNGNIGINNASPSGKLEVSDTLIISAGASSTTGYIRYISTGSVNYIQSGLTASSGSAAPLVIANMYNAAEWARFTATGQFAHGGGAPGSNVFDQIYSNTAFGYASFIGGSVLAVNTVIDGNGLVIQPACNGPVTGSGSCKGLYVAPTFVTGAGTTTYFMGVHIDGASMTGSGSGSVATNAYALYVNTPAYGTNKYCAYFQGTIGIGQVPSASYGCGINGFCGLLNQGTISQAGTIQANYITPVITSTTAASRNACLEIYPAIRPAASITVTEAMGLYILGGDQSGGSGNIVTTGYGVKIEGTGYGTTRYGLYVAAVSGGSSNYCAYFGNNVGIGTTTPSTQLELSQNSATKPTSNVWLITSDRRIKTNIQMVPLDECMDLINSLKIRSFGYHPVYAAQCHIVEEERYGLIAQEVEEVAPYCVQTRPKAVYTHPETGETYEVEDLKVLDSDELNYAMMGSVQYLYKTLQDMLQEMRKKDEAHDAEIAELRRRLDEKDARFAAIKQRLTST
jgi:hypothetical protein